MSASGKQPFLPGTSGEPYNSRIGERPDRVQSGSELFTPRALADIRTRREQSLRRRVSRSYDLFILSEIWREIARHAKERAGCRCGAKGCDCRDPKMLQVHHLTYIRFGGRELWPKI